MNEQKIPLWLDRHPILDPKHVDELENLASIEEFQNKLPRGQAEEAAYKKYKISRHHEAAAHHFAGMKAAHAAGDMDAARKHGALYQLHVEAVGGNAYDAPPEEVQRLVREKTHGIYRFKPHKSDLFAVSPMVKDK
jgi:hypothetical protein